MTEDILPYQIKIKFGRNSDDLTADWLNNNLAGSWSVGKEHTCYELFFECEEDALLTWWKWG